MQRGLQKTYLTGTFYEGLWKSLFSWWWHRCAIYVSCTKLFIFVYTIERNCDSPNRTSGKFIALFIMSCIVQLPTTIHLFTRLCKQSCDFSNLIELHVFYSFVFLLMCPTLQQIWIDKIWTAYFWKSVLSFWNISDIVHFSTLFFNLADFGILQSPWIK